MKPEWERRMKPEVTPLPNAEWPVAQQFGLLEGLLDTNVRGGRKVGLTMARPVVGRGAFGGVVRELCCVVASMGPRHAMFPILCEYLTDLNFSILSQLSTSSHF